MSGAVSAHRQRVQLMSVCPEGVCIASFQSRVGSLYKVGERRR